MVQTICSKCGAPASPNYTHKCLDKPTNTFEKSNNTQKIDPSKTKKS